MEIEGALNIIKKLKEILSPTFFGIIGLVCLFFGYFGADDLFGLSPRSFLFIGFLCVSITLSRIIDFGWKFYSEKREQKRKEAERKEQEELEKKEQKRKEAEEKEKEKQEKKKRQEKIKNIIATVESLSNYQFFVIEEMVSNDNNYFREKLDSRSDFQMGKKVFSDLKRKKIGYYDTFASHYEITFMIYSDVWEILMALYISQPELFERPDE